MSNKTVTNTAINFSRRKRVRKDLRRGTIVAVLNYVWKGRKEGRKEGRKGGNKEGKNKF